MRIIASGRHGNDWVIIESGNFSSTGNQEFCELRLTSDDTPSLIVLMDIQRAVSQ